MTETRFRVTEEAITLVRDTVRLAGATASTFSVQAAVHEAERNLDQLEGHLDDTATAAED